MYGLSKDFDATIFVGKELIEIGFTANTIHFSFSENISITLESAFVYRCSLGGEDFKESIPVLSSELMCLIGCTITSATSKPDGTITLFFDNGGFLSCLDDSQQYESYRIQIDTKEIIV